MRPWMVDSAADGFELLNSAGLWLPVIMMAPYQL